MCDFVADVVAPCVQVHKAVLKRGGPVRLKGTAQRQEVAVKVRHPGVSETIRRDFVIMNSMAQLCSTLPGLRWMRLDESVAQFAVFMLEQVSHRHACELWQLRHAPLC